MSNAVELFTKYQGAFTSNLPSHINPAQWSSVVYGILNTRPELAQAANNDPNRFLTALLNASRLGLEPGTEEYHLVPFKVKGTPVIQGIVGYQGLVELIYRAGAVASVIVEPVYTRDRFSYSPGRDDRPLHEIDWDAEDRGTLRLAYAYAIMKDGATSKVVVLNKAKIEEIKKSSQGSTSQYSPWNTHPESMWMKSAVRQLSKWTPTSAEYRREQLRSAQAVASESRHHVMQAPELADGEYVDEVTGEVMQAAPDVDVVDAEVVPDGQMFPEAGK